MPPMLRGGADEGGGGVCTNVECGMWSVELSEELGVRSEELWNAFGD